MTHEERMKKMRQYAREARQVDICMMIGLGAMLAFYAWLNVGVILAVLGE